MSREKTNSVTHLVKIVAKEVFDERTMHLTNRVDRLEKQLEENGGYKFVVNADEFLSNIQSSLEKAGRPWTAEEDKVLVQEVKTAIAQIAKNHHRSFGAIRSRIMQRDALSVAITEGM